MQKEIYGPFSYDKDGKTIRFYLASTTSRNTIGYIRFGMIVLKIPTKYFNRITSSFFVEKNLKKFLDEKRIFTNMKFKALNLTFRENLTAEYVFIKGTKYEVSNTFVNALNNGRTFYVSSKNMVKVKFDELALAYFKKRVEELRLIMGIPVSFEVKLSNATTFKGQNNFAKNIIKLDSHLYSYKECVMDAIIVHELAHYYHHDHSRAFYAVVYKYCPNYDRYTKIINEGRFESE